MVLASTTRPTRPGGIPAIAEGLSYVGGGLGLVGLVLFSMRSWEDFDPVARLLISAIAAVLLGLGGFILSDDDRGAVVRLRGFLWLVATAAAGVSAVSYCDEWMPDATDARRVLIVAGVVAAISAAFWWSRNGMIQQATAIGGALVAIGAGSQDLWDKGVAGLVVWLVAGTLLIFAVSYDVPSAWVTSTIAAIGCLAGVLYASDKWQAEGLLGTVVTAGAILWLSALIEVRERDAIRMGLIIVGIVGLVQSVPPTIVYFAEDAALNTGLAISTIAVFFVLMELSDRTPFGVVTSAIAGAALLGGAAITGAETQSFATIFGSMMAILLIAVGTTPRHVLTSIIGLAGLVIFVPWGISYFFPGQARVPLIVFVVGGLITASGIMLGRLARSRSKAIDVESVQAW
ncbi:MAG: hypothetical protein EBZ45_03960 [Actinobacteria bacterium]|nr:hypothetical protein [Actinomycetota bacterium]